MSTTDEFIVRADKTFADFERRVNDLRKDAMASEEMRGKDRFIRALSGFDSRIAQARQDLQELKTANTGSWEQYRRRVNEADADMRTSFDLKLGE